MRTYFLCILHWNYLLCFHRFVFFWHLWFWHYWFWYFNNPLYTSINDDMCVYQSCNIIIDWIYFILETTLRSIIHDQRSSPGRFARGGWIFTEISRILYGYKQRTKERTKTKSIHSWCFVRETRTSNSGSNSTHTRPVINRFISSTCILIPITSMNINVLMLLISNIPTNAAYFTWCDQEIWHQTTFRDSPIRIHNVFHLIRVVIIEVLRRHQDQSRKIWLISAHVMQAPSIILLILIALIAAFNILIRFTS